MMDPITFTQTLSACTDLVQFAGKVGNGIYKIFQARRTARGWLVEINHMEQMLQREIDRLEQYRAENGDRPARELQQRCLRDVHEAVVAGRECLREMKERLQPLLDQPRNATWTSMPAAVRFCLDQNFIRRQQSVLDKQVVAISLALHWLNLSISREHNRKFPESQTERSAALERIRESGGLDHRYVDGMPFPSDASPVDTGYGSVEGGVDVSPPGASEATIENATFEDRYHSDLIPSNPKIDRVLQAVKYGSFESAIKLISKEGFNATYCKADIEGYTILHYAVEHKNLDLLRAIDQPSVRAESGFLDFVNRRSYVQHTALMGAALWADSAEGCQMAKTLLDWGADMHAVDTAGRTALSLVVEDEHSRYCQYFARMLVGREGLSDEAVSKMEERMQRRVKSLGLTAAVDEEAWARLMREAVASPAEASTERDERAS